MSNNLYNSFYCAFDSILFTFLLFRYSILSAFYNVLSLLCKFTKSLFLAFYLNN